MKRWQLLTSIVCVLVGGGLCVWFGASMLRATSVIAPPTATETPSAAATTFVPPTETATETPSPSATPTRTESPMPSATMTTTLATLVLRVTVVNADVALDAPLTTVTPATPTAAPTLLIPAPGAQIPVFSTQNETSVPVGWYRYGVLDRAVQQTGKWSVFTASHRSADHGYLYTNAADARLTLHFIGAALRVRYARLFSYGIFEVRLDGQTLTTVDSYLPQTTNPHGDFVTTDIFATTYGWHTLEIIPLGRHNPASRDSFVAIDGVDVYLNGTLPTVVPTNAFFTTTPSSTPAPAARVQLLVAPPTVQPTGTPAPPSITAVDFTAAYDLNGNKAVDADEGIADLPVRLIAANTNAVVATGVTDGRGFLHLEATGNGPLRLVVPYFNRFWEVPARANPLRVTLLIPPANQPAVIP